MRLNWVAELQFPAQHDRIKKWKTSIQKSRINLHSCKGAKNVNLERGLTILAPKVLGMLRNQLAKPLTSPYAITDSLTYFNLFSDMGNFLGRRYLLHVFPGSQYRRHIASIPRKTPYIAPKAGDLGGYRLTVLSRGFYGRGELSKGENVKGPCTNIFQRLVHTIYHKWI